MKVIDSVQEAVQQVVAIGGDPEDFRLTISQQLLDPAGVNMAIITDYVLKRGWDQVHTIWCQGSSNEP